VREKIAENVTSHNTHYVSMSLIYKQISLFALVGKVSASVSGPVPQKSFTESARVEVLGLRDRKVSHSAKSSVRCWNCHK
jgi:hypothetical protein